MLRKREDHLDIHYSKVFSSELKTLEWNILNPNRLINLSGAENFRMVDIGIKA